MSMDKGLRPQDVCQVLLYVPNIIGYLRLVLLGLAALCRGGSWCFFLLYASSQILDSVDGFAARSLKQASVFGACLDQLTDRLSTCLLYILNAVAYPNYAWVFFCVLLADVGGHWVHFFAATAAGAASHKQVDAAPAILKLYYTSKALMVSSIFFYEGLFLSLLAAGASTPDSFARNAAIVCAATCVPLAAFKTLTNILQGFYGALRLASLPMPSVARKAED
uniref:CDP-diacylglycerol--inositol 3-phosphatidyltransferase n=1 Tax=Eimeria falciformis TaxID=84963 RepID=A0A221S613_9EIME|nr:phosphatidylinositol synthase [Eimeria falciformis]